jgi:RNA polymerase sigma factor (sigma-70 family)
MVPSEGILMGRIAAGDEAAVGLLLGPYRAGLVQFAAVRLGGDRHLAEDVVQEAMLNAYKSIRAGSRPQSLGAWLFTIVRNCAVNAQRGLRATDRLEDHHPSDDAQDPVAAAEQREWMAWLMDAIGELPPRQRDALVGHAFEGHSYREIAARQMVSLSAVKALIHRARSGLGSPTSLHSLLLAPAAFVSRRITSPLTGGSLAPKMGSGGVLAMAAQALGAATLTTGVLLIVPGSGPGPAIATGVTQGHAGSAAGAVHHHRRHVEYPGTPRRPRPAAIERRTHHEAAGVVARCTRGVPIRGHYTTVAMQYAVHHLPVYVREYTDCGELIGHAILHEVSDSKASKARGRQR